MFLYNDKWNKNEQFSPGQGGKMHFIVTVFEGHIHLGQTDKGYVRYRHCHAKRVSHF